MSLSAGAMTQDEKWIAKYNEVKAFIETNKRNPSKHIPEERYKYLNWLKQQRKLHNAGSLKPERAQLFSKLLELIEQHKRINQYA